MRKLQDYLILRLLKLPPMVLRFLALQVRSALPYPPIPPQLLPANTLARLPDPG